MTYLTYLPQTRILVTHSVTYLPSVDHIVVVKDGRVSEQGSYQQLLDNKGQFQDFLLQYLAEKETEEELPGEGGGVIRSEGGAIRLRGGPTVRRGGAIRLRGGATVRSGGAIRLRGGAIRLRGGATVRSGGAIRLRERSYQVKGRSYR